jgi:hypothetical protein
MFANFRRKIWRFSKKQCYDHFFAKKLAVVRAKIANTFAKLFGENIL